MTIWTKLDKMNKTDKMGKNWKKTKIENVNVKWPKAKWTKF